MLFQHSVATFSDTTIGEIVTNFQYLFMVVSGKPGRRINRTHAPQIWTRQMTAIIIENFWYITFCCMRIFALVRASERNRATKKFYYFFSMHRYFYRKVFYYKWKYIQNILWNILVGWAKGFVKMLYSRKAVDSILMKYRFG